MPYLPTYMYLAGCTLRNDVLKGNVEAGSRQREEKTPPPQTPPQRAEKHRKDLPQAPSPRLLLFCYFRGDISPQHCQRERDV